jgi:hypothetical protein
LRCCLSQVVEEHLKDKLYDETQIPHWVDRICQDCVKGLVALNKPFKYVGGLRVFTDSLTASIHLTFFRERSVMLHCAEERRGIALELLVLLGRRERQRRSCEVAERQAPRPERPNAVHRHGIWHQLLSATNKCVR